MTEDNYAEGQKVICIETPNGPPVSNLRGKGAGWQPNYIFTIKKITPATDTHESILWPVEKDSGVFSNYVQHITWEERYKK